jgi:hypothetical protein
MSALSRQNATWPAIAAIARYGPVIGPDDVVDLPAGGVVGRLVQQRRLHSQLGYVPPDEYEAAYYAQIQASKPAAFQL